MVTSHEIERQLKTIGADFRYWGRGEANELQHIIMPGEHIMYCLNGRYEGGFAMLCITNQRVVLIDKKPFYLTLEDLRYDMISEVDFSQRLLDATITICTINKPLAFTALKGAKLRKATAYVQSQVMGLRQQPLTHQQTVHYLQTAQDTAGVNSLQHRVTNPYTKVPLMMRRRVTRFYSS